MRKRYEVQGAEDDFLENVGVERQKQQKNSIHSVSPFVGLLFLCLVLGLYGVVYLIDDRLPTPIYIADEKSNPDAYIAERTRNDLKVLTDIGPRVTGSYENEALAVDFLKRELILIQNYAHPNQKVEVDIQTVSGSYFLNFKPHGAINSYGNIQNVIVKLHSRNSSAHSLLVNAHFDSVPTSPGGSDDGIMCVTMLEILRKLSRSPQRLQHNIVFLFNGAEETPLQASHGFITQHKWAKEVGVVVNLEAAGAGSKEVLFQAGPGQPWILNYYKKVPHPNGQAAGEEIFQSGLIPSDTDFRIFRDFGHTIGMDFAFGRNGYRYHTKYDDFSNIPIGTYQHVGDNILSVVRNLANCSELDNPQGQQQENFVYYDYLGLFMITYSSSTAIIINVVVAVVSGAVALYSFKEFGLGFSGASFKYLGSVVVATLAGWIAACIFVVVTALIIDAVNYSMSWYGNPWIIFGLYVVPIISFCAASISVLNHCYAKSKLSISAQAQVQAHVIRLIWTVPLLVGTFYGIRSVYAIMMPLLFQTITAIVLKLFSWTCSVRKWQITYVLGTIIPNMFLMKEARELLSLLVPICGRIGSDRNSEMYIGLITVLLTILIMSYYIPLITLVNKPLLLYQLLLGLFLVFFIIVFTPLGFPYSGNSESPAPQRFFVYHSSRTFRNDANEISGKDSGFALHNMDRNSPKSVLKYVKDFSRKKSIAEDCKKSLLCGLSLFTPRLTAIIHQTTWIPAGQPIIHEPVGLKLNSKTVLTDSDVRFSFTATGPSQFSIYISPRDGSKLISTSLAPHIETNPPMWNDRPVYFILHTWGKEPTPLTFSLDFETAANQSQPVLDIALAGTYRDPRLHVKTPAFVQFLNQFPDWADVVSYLGVYESWVY